MTTTITFSNGRTLPRSPHKWLASVNNSPCFECGAEVGEVHRTLGCPTELCPRCGEYFTHCGCKMATEIPNKGRYVWRYPWTFTNIEEFEDQNGQLYAMAVEEEDR